MPKIHLDGPWFVCTLFTLAAILCEPFGSRRGDVHLEHTDTCEAPCDRAGACCTERFIHGNGASVGWTRRGPAMFVIAEPDDAVAALAGLKSWIAGRPTRAGLTLAMQDLRPLAGLTIGEPAPGAFGPLRVHRFTQTYRGRPVVGAGAQVSLTLADRCAVSVSGALRGQTCADHGVADGCSATPVAPTTSRSAPKNPTTPRRPREPTRIAAQRHPLAGPTRVGTPRRPRLGSIQTVPRRATRPVVRTRRTAAAAPPR